MKKIIFLFLIFTISIKADLTKASLLITINHELADSYLHHCIACLEKNIHNPSIKDVHIIYDITKDDVHHALLAYLWLRPAILYYAARQDDYSLMIRNICNNSIILANLNSYFDANLNEHIFDESLTGFNSLIAPTACMQSIPFISPLDNKNNYHPAFISRLQRLYGAQLVFYDPVNDNLDAIDFQRNPTIILKNHRFLYPGTGVKKISRFGTCAQLEHIIQQILSHQPTYKIACIGDILIFFTTDQSISPIAQACTISRLFDDQPDAIFQLLKAEELIGTAQGIEKETIKQLALVHQESWNERLGLCQHYPLWYGLILMHDKEYEQAYKQFKLAQQRGLDHWRIAWYMGLAKSYGDHQ